MRQEGVGDEAAHLSLRWLCVHKGVVKAAPLFWGPPAPAAPRLRAVAAAPGMHL